METKHTTKIIIDTETTGVNPHNCKLLGIALSDGKKDISFGEHNIISFTETCANKEVIGQNIKYDLIVLARHGYKLLQAKFDTMIAHYLLYIDKSHKLENMVHEIFNIHKDDLVQVYNKSTGENRVNIPIDWHEKIDKNLLATYAMEDVEWTGKLEEYLSQKLHENPDLKQWFEEVEMPLVNIITEMELKGVLIDSDKLSTLRDEFKQECGLLHKRLIHLTGNKEFNLNSPKQLRELFKEWKFPVTGKTETGEVATNKEALKQLAKMTEHAFPILLLKFREIEKILSTYTDSLLEKLDSNKRLHTIYNQALTHTRRFSSENPNLQNIPTRSDFGKRIKSCFIPDKNHYFLVADYSQLEPRILAHLSGDKFLCERFKNNEDIYNYTTGIVQQAGFKDFSRDKSKILFLALMYGKSAYGLANDWRCSESEAQAIIDSVFQKLSGVREYIMDVQERAFKTGGWLHSLANLPLYVGNPHSNNKWERMEVDRKAVNYPIQASSQDILKKAIVNIYQKSAGMFYPVLMVHDELVFELKDVSFHDDCGDLVDQQSIFIVNEMEHAWDLKVPLKVEAKMTNKWEK